ncbi:DNA polymerase epsilon subunit 4 [Culicoides brevitarsis]|uniref:DNA polymerase epsilon subunit 4 n=1 Tax=Culicoides brevitarsis TaxID=469753 RepID=UPI00307BAAA1
MDNNQYSEELFHDSEDPNDENPSEKVTSIDEEMQDTPDLNLELNSEEPQTLGTNDETPDINFTEAEMSNDAQLPDDEEEIEEEDAQMGDLELDGDDEDVVDDEETPVRKPLALKQADFGISKEKEAKEKEPIERKLINLPLGRVKNIMKLDPDVRLMSGEAIFVVAKATELFIEALTKECMAHKDPKKKTIQKRDFDQVLASADALQFLEGAMDF